MMVPMHVTIVPAFAYGTFLMRQYFLGLPGVRQGRGLSGALDDPGFGGLRPGAASAAGGPDRGVEQVSHPDPAFPALHGRPARGWVNDPNGLPYVDGRYHVFFQYNPDSAQHNAIKWGHVSSTDLVSWREEPIALVNRPGEIDAYGCWSGCVVDDGGVPTAVYSAAVDGSGQSEVVLARSDRSLRHWKQDSQSVVGMPDDESIFAVRDPFVFTHGGRRFAIQGAGHQGGLPLILLYSCDDLTRWTPLNPLLTGTHPVAGQVASTDVWECPNLARIDGRWVLIVSLWRWVNEQHLLDGVRYLIGDLRTEGDGLRFEPTTGGTLDSGAVFYAPQILVQPDRTLLWGWIKEGGRTLDQTDAAGWAGSLTFPRELTVVDEALVSRPAAELKNLRRGSSPINTPFSARSFEVAAEGPASLVLLTGGQQHTVLELSSASRIFVDGSVIEAFPAESVPITLRVYPEDGSQWLVSGPGKDAEVWRLAAPAG